MQGACPLALPPRGEDGIIGQIAGCSKRRDPTGVPRAALLLQLAIVTVLLLTATFQAVLVYIQFALILSSFLTVLGLLVLRWREPELPRPYRVWGYPLTPLLFLTISGYMLIYVGKSQPLESLAGLGTMLLGLLVYFVFRLFNAPSKSVAHEFSASRDPAP